MTDIFQKLARHLDNTPGGFPSTPTGVELRILKQLFTTQEAEIALAMVMSPEPLSTISKKTGIAPDTLDPILKEMGQKGLILHIIKDNMHTFMLHSFVIGIWEYQVNRLTTRLIEDFNEYVPFLTEAQFKNKTQQLRVVPVGKSITTDLNIMDYDQVESIIKAQSKIRVAPCICRKEHTFTGRGCNKSEETCLIFGGGAYIYENRGIGRDITQAQALAIVDNAIKQGLVAQPSNSRKPINICLCCSCCCQILKNLKKLDHPSCVVSSNFHALIDNDNCEGCGECMEICPMDAITMNQELIIAQLDIKRCIGCGLCSNVCPFDAVTLTDKKIQDRIEPPANIVETYMTIAKEKGLF